MVLRFICALGSEVSATVPAENNPLILCVALATHCGVTKINSF